jgi:Uncharacterized conserved protein
MLTRDETEALNIACEMERQGIMVYRRAQALTEDEAVLALLKRLEADEMAHLGQFSAMLDETKLTEDLGERRVLLAAYAKKAFLQGGVMELVREEALQSANQLLKHAIKDETEAIAVYRAYSETASGEAVKKAFLSISREEETHLAALLEIASAN